MITLNSFAKINLGLEITGKRPDGYHCLRTLFQTIDLHDRIDIKENTVGALRLSGSDPGIQWDSSNTLTRAADAIYKNYNVRQGFDVFIHKNIPAGSGLGGGSSNAAVFLLFLANYFNLGIPQGDLVDIGVSIGADVPFFLEGGTVLAEGIGEKMTPLKDLPILDIGLVIPDVHVSTKLIFSHFNLTLEAKQSKIITFTESKNSLNFEILENDLEEVTFNVFPEIGAVKEKMKTMGFGCVMMSGSGSSLYGITTGNPRQELLSELKRRFTGSRVYLTRTLGKQEYIDCIGASPSGKASVFGADIQRFKSSRPSIL